MKKRSVNLRGMTAIEVLAATVLAALMLAAVSGILGMLARQDRELRSDRSHQSWEGQILERMRSDFRGSRLYSVSRERLQLVGFAARDFVTGQPTGRRAIIEYYLVEAKGERWLLRRESHPDDRTNDSSRVELACRGIDRVAFGDLFVDAVFVARNAPARPPQNDLASIPESVPIRMFASASVAPLIAKVLQVR